MGGAREVFECSCPSLHSPHGRRKAAIAERQAVRVKACERVDPNRPVTTPEMAKKAAEGLARGLSYHRAFKEAGFPKSTCKKSGKAMNRMVRAEMKKLGVRYIEMARDLLPEDQELIVRGDCWRT